MREFKGKKQIFYSVCAKMIICVLKRILPKKKNHFYPKTRITIPPYCLLLLCQKMVG